MKNTSSLTTLILLSFFTLLYACDRSGKSQTNEAFDPVGKWNYKVTTDVSYGVITIQKVLEGYSARMTTEVFGTLTLNDLEINGKKLTANLDVGGTPAKIYCDFDGKGKMKGAVQTADTEFPFIGDKQKD